MTWYTRHSTEQGCSLQPQACLGWARACIEDWMKILYSNPCLAFFGWATVHPLIPILSILQRPQDTMATCWTKFAMPFGKDVVLLQKVDEPAASDGHEGLNRPIPSCTMRSWFGRGLAMPHIWNFLRFCFGRDWSLQSSGFSFFGHGPYMLCLQIFLHDLLGHQVSLVEANLDFCGQRYFALEMLQTQTRAFKMQVLFFH